VAKNKQPEYELQKAVVTYLTIKYPKVLYCASAGGVRTSMSQARKMKATGYKKGFPDLFIYECRGNWCGLAVELKVKGNYPNEYQKKWQEDLGNRGYCARICTGLDEAIETIKWYLSL